MGIHVLQCLPRIGLKLPETLRALPGTPLDYEAAAARVCQDAEDHWDALRFEQAVAPYFEEYAEILFTPDARNSRRTLIKSTRPRRWDVSQVLVDPEGDCLWAIEGAIDLSQQRDPEDPIVQIRRIGT